MNVILAKFWKEISIIAILSIAILFHQYTVNGLESKINDLTKENIHIQKNYDKVFEVYASNKKTLEQYKIDVQKLKNSTDIIIKSKDNQISDCKKIVQSLSQPVEYTGEVQVQNCKVKIYEGNTSENFIHDSLNNIGY
jgi:hypothetical protein